MIKRLTVLSAGLIICLSLCAPNVIADVPVEKEGTATIKALLNQADQMFNSREYVKSRDIYAKVADKARATGDNSGLAEAHAMIARTYLVYGKMEIAELMLAKAGETAAPDEPSGWSRYLGARGRLEWREKNLETATATFKEMYDYCTQNKLHERAVDAAHMIAITGPPEEQIEWGKKGIAEAQTGNVTVWLGPMWNNLAATYEDLGQYAEALKAYLKAREYHYQYGDEMNRLIADWAVGHAYRLNGDTGQARKWLEPLIDRCEKLGAAEYAGRTHKEFGEIELARGNHRAALYHLGEAEKKLKAAGMPSWAPDDYKNLLAQIEEIKTKAGE
ncbi:MAG: tetratricopeptide repeat protein [Candidatus Zixiibacteriota bacterium]|nr:MAG: tetratricopeptide repeat protein [candidate division Zixibacteria bacterium]